MTWFSDLPLVEQGESDAVVMQLHAALAGGHQLELLDGGARLPVGVPADVEKLADLDPLLGEELQVREELVPLVADHRLLLRRRTRDRLEQLLGRKLGGGLEEEVQGVGEVRVDATHGNLLT